MRSYIWFWLLCCKFHCFVHSGTLSPNCCVFGIKHVCCMLHSATHAQESTGQTQKPTAGMCAMQVARKHNAARDTFSKAVFDPRRVSTTCFPFQTLPTTTHFTSQESRKISPVRNVCVQIFCWEANTHERTRTCRRQNKCEDLAQAYVE